MHVPNVWRPDDYSSSSDSPYGARVEIGLRIAEKIGVRIRITVRLITEEAADSARSFRLSLGLLIGIGAGEARGRRHAAARDPGRDSAGLGHMPGARSPGCDTGID